MVEDVGSQILVSTVGWFSSPTDFLPPLPTHSHSPLPAQRLTTPRQRTGRFLKEEHVDTVGGWLKGASEADSAKFDRVFSRLAHDPSAPPPSSSSPSSSPFRSSPSLGRSSRSVSRSGLLGTTRSVESYGSTFERSTYTNDFRKYAASAAPSALIPQHEHTRLDDFDQRVPPSTYQEDFVNHPTTTGGQAGPGIEPNKELLETSAAIARMKSLARGPPQSMYSTDFHPYSEKQQELTRAASVKPLHGRPTLGRHEDEDVRKYMLASCYGRDFVDHASQDWDALAAQTAEIERAQAEKSADSDAAQTVYQRSFRPKGNPDELRGRTVKSLYSAKGGLPGVPDLNGRDPAATAVRLSMLRTTYDNDFNGQQETAESMQRLYADLIPDDAKPEVAAWIANEATPAEKAEFKDVLVQLQRAKAEEEMATAPKSHVVGGHKFFV